jgi:hypothetical protein
MTTYTNVRSPGRVMLVHCIAYRAILRTLRITSGSCFLYPLLLCWGALLIPDPVQSQVTAIPSAGGHSPNHAEIQIDWTIGYAPALPCPDIHHTGEKTAFHTLSVHPNPAVHTLQVDLPQALIGKPVHFYMSDALDRVVWQYRPTSSLTTEQLDIAFLPAGTYLLHVKGADDLTVPPSRIVKVDDEQNR